MRDIQAKLMQIKRAMHLLSFLGYPFFIAGLVYLMLFFFSSANKMNHLSMALLFMGFVMSFAGMGDLDALTEKETNRIVKHRNKQYLRLILGISGFIFSTLLGLFWIFYIRDYALGFAITAFGVGGLALQKYQLDVVLSVPFGP